MSEIVKKDLRFTQVADAPAEIADLLRRAIEYAPDCDGVIVCLHRKNHDGEMTALISSPDNIACMGNAIAVTILKGSENLALHTDAVKRSN